MKILILLAYLFSYCSAQSQAEEDSTLALVIQREIVKKKLEKIGYFKWVRVKNEYLTQAMSLQETRLEAISKKQREQLLSRDFESLKAHQQKSLNSSKGKSLKDIEKQALLLEQKQNEQEQALDKIKVSNHGLAEIVRKHVVLLKKIEQAELTLRKSVEDNAKEINVLLKEYNNVSEHLRIADLKKTATNDKPTTR